MILRCRPQPSTRPSRVGAEHARRDPAADELDAIDGLEIDVAPERVDGFGRATGRLEVVREGFEALLPDRGPTRRAGDTTAD